MGHSKLLISKWLERIKTPFELASYVGGLVGIFLIFVQLNQDSSDRRIERTLSLVEQFNGEALKDQKAALLAPLIQYRGAIAMANALGGLKEQDAEAVTSALVDEYKKTHPNVDFDLALHEVVDFFNSAQICVDGGICDAAVARRYFVPYAQQISCIYRKDIADQVHDLGNPALDDGILYFAKGTRCG